MTLNQLLSEPSVRFFIGFFGFFLFIIICELTIGAVRQIRKKYYKK